MGKLLKIRSVRVYLAGQGLSILGDSSMWLAAGIWVKELTGSSGLAALSIFFLTLPTLFAPILGVVVDRVRRRPLLLITNLVAAGVVLSLLAVHGRHQLWLIWTVMLAYGLVNSIIGSAQTAYLPTLVPPELLGDAQGALGSLRQGLRLVSPLIGAGLFALYGGGAVAILDAVTFLVAAVCMATLPSDQTPTRSDHVGATAPRWRVEVAAGFQHIRATVVLRQLCLAAMASTVVFGFIESTTFSVVTAGLHHRASWVGVTSTAMGVGAVVGGAIVGRAIRRWDSGRTAAAGLLAFAAMNAAMLTDSDIVVLAGSAVGGFGLVWVIAGAMTSIQLHTPADIMGRVAATFDSLATGPQTLSIGIGAALIGIVGYRWMLVAMLVGMGGAGTWLLTRAEQRQPAATRPSIVES
jgi:MFS family permease